MFVWPALLALLLLLPFAWLAYRRGLWGRAETHASHPDVELLSQASNKTNSWKRHLPAALYGLALTLALFGLARPQALVPLPDQRAGVMLALDISGSMRATDVQPSRFEAAQKAAKEFVVKLPSEVKVGLVSFAGYAVLDSPLGHDKKELLEKIDLLERRRGTAIGEGLRESSQAFPGDLKSPTDGPATVILLSDGRNTTGITPSEAAQIAKKRKITVHTIGVGTPESNINPDQNQGFGGPRFSGFDETELKGIAEATGGRYYSVQSAERLEQVYRELGSMVGWRWQRSEITALATLGAGLLVGLSLLVGGFARRLL